MPRARSTRTMKKRESMTRGEATFHASFPNLANCVRCATAERSITTFRAIRRLSPSNGRPTLRRANGSFAPSRKPPAAPATAPAGCALQIARPRRKQQRPCKRIAEPFFIPLRERCRTMAGKKWPNVWRAISKARRISFPDSARRPAYISTSFE